MGRQTVAAFRALGTNVIAVGRPGREYDLPAGVRRTDTFELSAVLPETDVLVLCCPLTPDTEGLVGAAELALLPESAVLINISRGQVVDEDALIEALRNRAILGAALDVFHTEPLPVESPLWDMDNVLISPHSASTVATENRTIVDLFTDNIQRWFSGHPLRNRYQRELGY
jgi:phosphoglycerate dehydrogenase-like enzyme